MHARSLARTGLAALTTGALTLTGVLAAAPLAQAAGTPLVINEVYGGGGNSGATYTHDFVELFNGTDAAIDLSGYVVQYYSAAGNPGSAANTCTLSGTIAPGSHFLIQQAAGAGGTTPLPTPDQQCSAAMAGTAGSVRLFDAAGGTVDTVGYGNVVIYEGAPAQALTNATSASRTDGIDTDNNAADFTRGAPTPQNSSWTEPEPEPEPDPLELTIADIQGTGTETPYRGQVVATTGVVTAAYPTGGFRGVYLQTPGSGGVEKAPGDASDGIFVFSDWVAGNLEIGDCVEIEGTAAEFNGLTQLTNAFAERIEGCEPVLPTALTTLPATDAEKEVYEGMLVHPQGTYTITNNYQLNQFGQLGLAVGDEPLYTATDVVRPGAEALAYEAENLRRYITLDDGSSWNYMTNATAKETPLPYLSADAPRRTGSQLSFTDPVILDYRFQWNFQPVAQVVGADSPVIPISSENDREYDVPQVGGNLQIGAFNVLNYFTDLGQDEEGCAFYADREGNPVTTNWCEVRGAWTTAAFEDQQAKIVAAINGMDADVLALQEIEANSALSYKDLPRDTAIADLVDALNADVGATRWAYVPSPVGQVPSNEDIIRTGFIYNPNTVQLLGSSQILLDDAFANARYPLAQKFKARQTGNPFVAINNHYKSKGSGEDDGTGQGLANPSREAQSRALTSWVSSNFRGDAVFLMGDFNAYAKETPIQIIEGAGFTNLAKTYEPTSTTYQFSGRLGSLDHVFANAHAQRLVTGAAVWDINGDESVAFEYSRRNYNITDFYAPDQFASSDHDPIVVGLNTGNRGRGNN
ncbi:ExeM/NucH family extracellular endonuclease [Ornithinimicrobium sp. Y1847]|uniref:ExeM/NucH family extracellular endonuclease n=1 Tax=Ornithinimicrobium sp. Y1847 TaxID=3405419 RepID=UPI003B66F302